MKKTGFAGHLVSSFTRLSCHRKEPFERERSGRFWPIAIALVGSSLVLLGLLAGDLHAIEWVGVLC